MAAPSTWIRLAAVCAASAALSSCVAEMVSKTKPRRGPVPEVGYVDPGGGEMRYSTEGWDWVVASRRSTAIRRMRRVCRDMKVNILKEFSTDDIETPYAQDDMKQLAKGVEHFKVAPHRHIVFECAPKEQPAAPAPKQP